MHVCYTGTDIRMKSGNATSDTILSFCRDFQHDSLVRLYGVCTRQGPIFIVTELMINGKYSLSPHMKVCVRNRPSQLASSSAGSPLSLTNLKLEF